MKTKTAVFLILLVLIVCCTILYRILPEPDGADQSAVTTLPVSDIDSIFVYSPNGKRQQALTQEEIEEVSSALAMVELSGEGDKSYRDYDGMFAQMFHVVLTGEEEFDFAACAPFYVVDDKLGYRCEYEPCNSISKLYWQLVKKYFPEIKC